MESALQSGAAAAGEAAKAPASGAAGAAGAGTAAAGGAAPGDARPSEKLFCDSVLSSLLDRPQAAELFAELAWQVGGSWWAVAWGDGSITPSRII